MLSPALPCPALPCPACTALPLLTPILVIAGAYRYKAAALTCSAVSECLVSSHKAASCLTTHVASANCRNNDELPPLWLGSWIGQGEHGTVGLPASPTGPPQQPTRNTACVRVREVSTRLRMRLLAAVSSSIPSPAFEKPPEAPISDAVPQSPHREQRA
ncbi:uncharacterized protein BKA78DRAFT_372783 [Phyllosticta capitalensis]|uniref:uncharacterized protein n=1 Tax=Phyllosticta capitalensis TaxID=121624 RepID=UPI003130E429